MRIAFVSSAVPRRCGIATFTADLTGAIRAADPRTRSFAAAIDEPDATRAYDKDVLWRIRQSDPGSYADAADAISRSTVDIVNVQHEFGLYGRWHDGAYDDHLLSFLERCTKPTVVTLHTVPPRPEPWALQAVRDAAHHADVVVVMAATAARLLRDVYGIADAKIAVIEHGMPAIERGGHRLMKRRLGLEGHEVICTFGLVDPRKGLEHVVEAMPEILERHPGALYLIVGQTHPELIRHAGEAYRTSLADAARRLGIADRVRFVDRYLSQEEIVDHLTATDVYVTPYLDPDQITSGTLAYALGAGKAIVSTPYLHAREVLADGLGILVPFRDAGAIAGAVNGLLDDPLRRSGFERRAYAYGRTTTWPAIGARVLALMRGVLATTDPAPVPSDVLVA